jgi:hypothetical protein
MPRVRKLNKENDDQEMTSEEIKEYNDIEFERISKGEFRRENFEGRILGKII